VSAADLAVMRGIDELHLNYPFAGSRMLRDFLRGDGVRGTACQAVIASSVSQTVKLPRWRKLASHVAQLDPCASASEYGGDAQRWPRTA
jgi:hypothetical protein